MCDQIAQGLVLQYKPIIVQFKIIIPASIFWEIYRVGINSQAHIICSGVAELKSSLIPLHCIIVLSIQSSFFSEHSELPLDLEVFVEWK
jgi:hypothetical protein